MLSIALFPDAVDEDSKMKGQESKSDESEDEVEVVDHPGTKSSIPLTQDSFSSGHVFSFESDSETERTKGGHNEEKVAHTFAKSAPVVTKEDIKRALEEFRHSQAEETARATLVGFSDAAKQKVAERIFADLESKRTSNSFEARIENRLGKGLAEGKWQATSKMVSPEKEKQKAATVGPLESPASLEARMLEAKLLVKQAYDQMNQAYFHLCAVDAEMKRNESDLTSKNNRKGKQSLKEWARTIKDVSTSLHRAGRATPKDYDLLFDCYTQMRYLFGVEGPHAQVGDRSGRDLSLIQAVGKLRIAVEEDNKYMASVHMREALFLLITHYPGYGPSSADRFYRGHVASDTRVGHTKLWK